MAQSYIFWKIIGKIAKFFFFFSKINLVAPRKKIFNFFFQQCSNDSTILHHTLNWKLENCHNNLRKILRIWLLIKEYIFYLMTMFLKISLHQDLNLVEISQIYSCKDYLFSSFKSVLPFFMHMSILFIIKHKAHELINISTIASFCVTFDKVWYYLLLMCI